MEEEAWTLYHRLLGAVEGVANYGEADGFQVNADLVCATSLRRYFKKRDGLTLKIKRTKERVASEGGLYELGIFHMDGTAGGATFEAY